MRLQALTKSLTMVSAKEDSKRDHYRRFNCSIIHHRDDLYLMTYRLFYAPTRLQQNTTKGAVSERYHPWNSSWGSEIDQPILTLLRYNRKSKTFAVIDEQPLRYFCPHDIPINDVVADARLVKYGERVYAHGNGWGLRADEIGAQKKQLKHTVVACTRSKSCELVVEMLMRLDSDRPSSMPSNVSELVFPCLDNDFSYNRRGGDIVEKNWSFFEVDGRFFTEYMLAPHIIAEIDMHSDRASCNHPVDCRKVHRHEDTVFGRIAGLHKQGDLFFSPGGSPIRYSEHEMINVGHVKYDANAISLLPIDRSRTRMHPSGFVYLMFFYTFSVREPFELLRCSESFIPYHKGNPYALVFAMGVAPVVKTDDFVVSYGEGDDTSMLLTLKRSEIDRLLRPVDEVDPKAYRFYWMRG